MKIQFLTLFLVSLNLSAFESGFYENQQACEMLISCQKITIPAVCNGYIKKRINGHSIHFDIHNVPFESKGDKRLLMQKREVIPDAFGQPVFHHVNGIMDKEKEKFFSVKFQSFYNEGLNFHHLECKDMKFSLSLNDIYNN